jgi:hypothetical protein
MADDAAEKPAWDLLPTSPDKTGLVVRRKGRRAPVPVRICAPSMSCYPSDHRQGPSLQAVMRAPGHPSGCRRMFQSLPVRSPSGFYPLRPFQQGVLHGQALDPSWALSIRL